MVVAFVVVYPTKSFFFRKSTTSCKYYKKNLKTPYNSEKGKSPYFEGILPKIAIPIPIAILKKIGDPDPDRGFAIADLFSDLFNCWLYMFFRVKSKNSFFSHYG